jgi:hypothetical protein
MPEYKVIVSDRGGAVGANVAWKRYRSEVPLVYGNEITIEPEEPGAPEAPGTLRVRVTAVDNDALFTPTLTVEPAGGG